MECLYSDPELHKAPVYPERPAVRIKGSNGKRYGRKLSKLADATAAVVLSRSEFVARCRERKARLDELTKQSRNQGSHDDAERLKRAALAQQLRELFVPLWLVTMEGESYYVSPNVVSDWRTERIPFRVMAKQRLSRIGRTASVRKIDVDASVVEQSADARGNRHAMGLAQNAWRIANWENNEDAKLAAHHWLFHGSLKPCSDPECLKREHSPCRYRRMQSAELTHLAFRYLESELKEQRSFFNGSRRAHKMRQPSTDELALAFKGWR